MKVGRLSCMLIIFQAICSRHLNFFNMVKTNQGSVEVTTYGQMENILKYGRYQVKISTDTSNVTAKTLHDLISVQLHLKEHEDTNALPKMSYSLSDLRDIESKLVLISGNRKESKKEVDLFFSVSM